MEHKCNLNNSETKICKDYSVELKSKSVQQLEELLERQIKILHNKNIITKLPDNGEKIFAFKTNIENELKKRQTEDQDFCKLFKDFTLNELALQEIEWNNGSLNMAKTKCAKNDETDSELEFLKIMANHSGTVSNNLSGNNILESAGSSLNISEKKFYAQKFCEMFEKFTSNKSKFKPNQLKDHNEQLFKISAEKVKIRLGEKWEVTEATPPIPVFKDSMVISLSESLKLQKAHIQKLRELKKKHASETLIKNLCLKKENDLPLSNITHYRTIKTNFDEIDEDGKDDDENDSYEEEI